jgi:hypothetical protein
VEDKVGNSWTVFSKTGPSQLSFSRSSGIGLTALEMQLLADWLQSPTFPRGLNTFASPETPHKAFPGSKKPAQ